jgi:VanZ family protein
MKRRSSRFARYLLGVYWLLIVYGSLYPFAGWRDQGLSPFEFLTARLPRWVTGFDIAANIAAYVPLGFLGVMAVTPGTRRRVVYGAVALAAALTSLCVESLQNYLPDRIPSNLDVAANLGGALIGAAAGYAASRWLIERRGLFTVRDQWFEHGARVDLGLVLVALWLFTQLNPETLLFGNGDLRPFFETAPSELYAAQMFVRVEAAVAATNTVALALLIALLVAVTHFTRALVVSVVVAGLATRALAFGILFDPHEMLAWLTPGAVAGLAIGIAIALLAVALPRAWVAVVCGMALMVATALVNLAPDNPYHAQTLAAWPQGHFLNFNGLTRLVSVLWPFATLGYLLAVVAHARLTKE